MRVFIVHVKRAQIKKKKVQITDYSRGGSEHFRLFNSFNIHKNLFR